MKKYKYLVVLILSTCMALSSCSENMSNKQKGEFVGYLVGGGVGLILGDDLGIGDGVGMIVGAVAGTILGGAIGEKLDEIDKLKAEVATMNALKIEEEATVHWKSDKNEGVSGKVSTKKTVMASNDNCRVVSHVVNIRGEEYSERDTLCRQSDGSWALS